MSYYNQGPPPQGPQYPPQHGGYPPPQQQGYNHGPPPPMNQGYQQQGWNQPPPQGYGGSPYPPHNAPYGPPPGSQQYNAPPGQFGGPPPGQYGPPPGQYGPPPGQYGPPGGYATPPSMGYIPGQQANQDMSRAADDLRNAMKGFGTNEVALIKILAPLDPLEINSVKDAFHARHHRTLATDIHKETSGHFRDGLESIVRGPLDQDCHVLHESIQGAGTNETAMNDVLLSRSNADIVAIKQRYHQLYHRTLESDVKGDLSMKTERLFDMVLSARRNEESAPVLPQQVDDDVHQLYTATEGKSGTDQMVVCSIVSSRSNGQLRAIAQAYRQRFQRPLEDVLRKEFSGHMEAALLYMLAAAEDPAKHDAFLLENTMKGMGTQDHALVRRIVMIHWDKARLQQCKAAYKHFFKRDLAQRIREETRGDYEKLMVVCIGEPLP